MTTKSPIIAIVDGLKVAKEYGWLLTWMAFMLACGTAIGIRILDYRNEQRLSPIVDLILFDFKDRGVLERWEKHRAEEESDRKLLQQRDASILPYPLTPRSN